jgi:membrane protein
MSVPKKAFALVKSTGQEVMEDDVLSMSAAIAYYTLLSLPPLLAVIVAAAGAIYGTDAVREALVGQLSGLIGDDGAAQLSAAMQQAGDAGSGLFTQIIGGLALLFGATAAFAQFQQALNRAWDVEPAPGGNAIKTFLTKRLLSFGMVLTLGFLLIASLVVSAAVEVLGDQLGMLVGGAGAVLVQVSRFVLPVAILTALFAAMFRFLPDARIAWRDVWVGGFATAVLFVVGKFLIGFYIGRAEVGEAFGAAGSIVIVLVWIYYTALIVLVGAEFTQVWARRHGGEIEPAPGAVRMVRERRPAEPGEGPAAEIQRAYAEAAPAPASREGHPYTTPREPQPRGGINPEPGKR